MIIISGDYIGLCRKYKNEDLVLEQIRAENAASCEEKKC